MNGGVLFITSRILVVDMLTDKVPMDLLSGIFVCNAHRVQASSTEAFILRLFRYKNRKGFIRAVTDYPESFLSTNSSLEKTLKALWLQHVHIWPRFEQSISECLQQVAAKVTEVRISMTDHMLRIQQSIADILAACFKELKKTRLSLDVSRLNLGIIS